MNNLVIQPAYDSLVSQTQQKLNTGYWKARYLALVGTFEWQHLDKLVRVTNNPYYAVVNVTAFCLHFGYFRGYEHFASVFFASDSLHYLGIKVHKERTRTNISKGNYVTDWYVTMEQSMEATDHEQMYRAAVGMLVACELKPRANFAVFTENHDHNIRMKDDGDTQAQIGSS